MTSMQQLLTEHMTIWTAADTEKKSGRGRASGNAGSVYGIKKLRELILELAVHGKLVPQHANDEPASDLLKRILAEKVKLNVPISKDEKPFELPNGWEHVRLGILFDIVYGKGLSNSELTEDGYEVFGANGIIGKYPKYLYEEPQLLMSCRGAYSGKPNISPAKCYVTSNSLVLGSSWKNIDLKYFYYSLSIANKEKIVTGTAQPQVTTTNLEPFVVGLPPLAEQHRIVAKVDELMALCDQLEAQHSNAAEAHEKLVSHLLGTLTQTSVRPELVEGCGSTGSPRTEFEENWQRIAAHFDTLFTTEASIDALKQTLLQLAVMGKLVPQDPNDEPASELLKRIQAEKAKLVAEGKIKKDKPLAAIDEDEKPFKLPNGWEWSKVLDCSVFVTDGEHATPKRTSDGLVPLVTAKNVRDGYMDYDDTDFVDILVAEKCWNRCKPEQDDLLMVSVGATLGRLTILHESKDMVIVRSVTLIRPCLLNPLYLSLAIKSPLVQQAIWGSVRQMAQPGLYLAQSSNLVIPLPPLSEQHRIVIKVDELMTLCDQLKARIITAKQLQQKLADVMVEQAVR